MPPLPLQHLTDRVDRLQGRVAGESTCDAAQGDSTSPQYLQVRLTALPLSNPRELLDPTGQRESSLHGCLGHPHDQALHPIRSYTCAYCVVSVMSSVSRETLVSGPLGQNLSVCVSAGWAIKIFISISCKRLHSREKSASFRSSATSAP
jgi:hypothetical protein